MEGQKAAPKESAYHEGSDKEEYPGFHQRSPSFLNCFFPQAFSAIM